MNLYKREGSPYFWFNVRINGARKRVSTQKTTQREAFEAATAILEKMRARSSPMDDGKERATVKEAYERYLQTQHKAGTYMQMLIAYRKLFGIDEVPKRLLYVNGKPVIKKPRPLNGTCWHLPDGLMMHELTTAHVTKLREKRTAEGLANYSVNTECKFLQAVYNRCAKEEWAIEVSSKSVKFSFLEVKPKTRFLSVEEEQRVLEHLNRRAKLDSGYSFRSVDLFVFLIDTGARLGEALALPWQDIDMARGSITLYRYKTTAQSAVGMTRRVKAVLARRRALEGRLVFEHMDRPIKHIRKAINEACNQDPIMIERHGRATIHSLRDTFATRLVMRGVSLYQVSKLLGHTTTKMTEKYAHIIEAQNAVLAATELDAFDAEHQVARPRLKAVE